jgi:cholesterol oxidase
MTGYQLRFTEEMAGFVAFDAPDPAAGDAAGRAAGSRLLFHLTIVVDDVDRFVDDPEEHARATGWISCDLFGGRLPVERGDFNLFVEVADGHKQMRYRLLFDDAAGHPLTLVGRKEVVGGPLTEVWAPTTTLYTTVQAGHRRAGDPDGRVVLAGILHISPPSFARQLTTFRVRGPSWSGRGRALVRFGRLFAGHLWDVFLRRRKAGSPR